VRGLRPFLAATAVAAAWLVPGCAGESARVPLMRASVSAAALAAPASVEIPVACGAQTPMPLTNQRLIETERPPRGFLGMFPLFQPQIVLPTRTLWPVDRPLRVRFLDATPARRQRVQTIAQEWMLPGLALTLQFVDAGPAEIRVSLPPAGGAESAVGIRALVILEPAPTMTIGFADTMPEDRLRALVLHEFGHAIGALHEHQRPDAGITWNKPNVYSYYKQQYGWDAPLVDAQIFTPHAAGLKSSAEFDPASVMMYAILPGFTTDNFVQGWNTQLSRADAALVKELYGK